MHNFNNVSAPFSADFLSLIDDGSYTIESFDMDGSRKTISISREPSPTFCPLCNNRMHSRGIYTRTVNHPIFQDGSTCILKVNQRKWRCPQCNHYMNDSFPFLRKYVHYSDITPLLILDAMKDLNRTTASVARQFNISDTEAHNIFTSLVDLDRLPLTEYISVDEVYLNINHKRRYAFVIIDFLSGQIIDIVPDRYRDTLDQYFYHIPLEERKRVKGIISDMYKPYLELPKKYFPNAVTVIDSFHVTQFLIQKINIYINGVAKRYKEKNQKELEKNNHDTNRDYQTIRDSKELVLLKKYRWILLKNQEDIKYSLRSNWHSSLHAYMTTERIEQEFLKLDPNFKTIRDLKEKFIAFNHSIFNSEDQILHAMNLLIDEFKTSDILLFNEFADFLKRYRIQYARSFQKVLVHRSSINDASNYYSRLNNSYMESMNRKPKDYKRNTRGSTNFNYTRNRILWSTRDNPPIQAVPKSSKEVHSFKGKKRSSYNK